MDEMAELETKINTLLDEIEVLGQLSSVSRALDQYHIVQNFKIDRVEKEKELKTLTEMSGASGHQKLQVCDVCGAYLSRLDNDRRLADHFFGKMHMGYSDMRKGFKKLSAE